MNELTVDILKWAGIVIFFGLLAWLQRKLFGPKKKP